MTGRHYVTSDATGTVLIPSPPTPPTPPSWTYAVSRDDLPDAEPGRNTWRLRIGDYVGPAIRGDYQIKKRLYERVITDSLACRAQEWAVTVYDKADAAMIKLLFPSAREV